MLSRIAWVLVFLTLVVFVQSGSALRCWVCASNTNSLCGDPLNTTEHQATFHTRVCEASSYETSKHICRKIVRRENGERVVVRQCSTPNVDEADITDGPCSATAISSPSVVESCHICSTDLCNSATNVSIMQPLFFVTFAVIGHRSFLPKFNVP